MKHLTENFRDLEPFLSRVWEEEYFCISFCNYNGCRALFNWIWTLFLWSSISATVSKMKGKKKNSSTSYCKKQKRTFHHSRNICSISIKMKWRIILFKSILVLSSVSLIKRCPGHIGLSKRFIMIYVSLILMQ